MTDNKQKRLLVELEKWLPQGNIPCRSALELANDLDLSPAKVGQALEEMGLKVIGCQLGCFGNKKGDTR